MKLVEIRSYDNYVQAHIDLGVLKDEGIDSWLKDEHSVTVNPVLTNAVGGIKLLVPQNRAKEALEVLIRRQAAWIGQQVCPRCGSDKFLSKKIDSQPKYWLESIIVFFLGKSALGQENLYYCMQCGEEFKTPVTREVQGLDLPD